MLFIIDKVAVGAIVFSNRFRHALTHTCLSVSHLRLVRHYDVYGITVLVAPYTGRTAKATYVAYLHHSYGIRWRPHTRPPSQGATPLTPLFLRFRTFSISFAIDLIHRV